jgi:hypothetical protein
MKTWHIVLGLASLTLAPLLPADEPPPKAQPQAVDQVVAELRQIATLLHQLDDPKFEVRQKASDQLQQIGTPVVEPLKRLLAGNPPLEVAARATTILQGIKKEKSKAAELRAKLNQPVNLDKGIDGHTPLKDAVEFLADRYDLTLIIDTKAFEAIGVQKAEEQPVSLPKMVGVSMATVLRMLLAQVRGDNHHGTFALRFDYVEITTTAHVFSAGRLTEEERRRLPTVDAEFDRTPLDEALREVTDRTGTNVVLDTQVGDKGRRVVTARLAVVPVDTAVRLLADMAELRAVAIDNVIYVTSIDKAKQLQAEQDAHDAKRREAEKQKKAEEDKANAPPKGADQ